MNASLTATRLPLFANWCAWEVCKLRLSLSTAETILSDLRTSTAYDAAVQELTRMWQ